MIISNMKAQSVMIGIDSEQIMPMARPLSVWQGPPPALSRSLWNGHGSTDITRSPNPSPLARCTWPQRMLLISNAVFLLNLRSPAGVVSNGKAMRIGRAGASGSKKLASWNGSVAGVLNRWLRWDSRRIVDEVDRLELPLFVVSGEGAPPPRPGYPTKGDLRPDPAPIRVTVTPRRVQRFRCLPSERVRWRFGAASGVVEADADGVVTIRDLEVKTTPEVLVLERG